MTTAVVRTGARLGLLFVCAATSGCYIPGGGWTMRTGLDVRRYHKPSAFLELVDTRWDEYNRVAELNLLGGPIDPRGGHSLVPAQWGSDGPAARDEWRTTGAAFNHAAEWLGRRHRSRTQSIAWRARRNLPPPPGVGPTAQRPQTDDLQLGGPGPQSLESGADREAAGNDIDDEADDDAGSRPATPGDNGKLSSYRRTPRSNASSAGAPTARVQPVAGRSLDTYRRPTASRLFSPTR